MKIPIFHSYAKWYLSGVNTWTVNLIRAMEGDERFNSKVLFTGISPCPQPELDQQEIPYDFLELPRPRKRRSEWKALKAYLESKAPCIYITNFDFHRSCAVGTLSPNVRVLTVVHSDEERYFDEVERIGKNCDGIVAVSDYIAEQLRKRFPGLAERIFHIPYGIPLPTKENDRATSGLLKLAYCNRLDQYQKRVFDLPEVVRELKKIGITAELTVAGDGQDAKELEKRFQEAGVANQVSMVGRVSNERVTQIFSESHFSLLTSDFEGLPISLLESMATGCVPCVYKIKSGVREALTGLLDQCMVGHAEPATMARRIAAIWNNQERWTALSEASRKRAREMASLENMANAYQSAFNQILSKEIPRSAKIHRPDDIKLPRRIKRRLFSFFHK